MDRLSYRPNLFAVNFNRRNPKTVGIIVPTLLDPFYAALVQRIEFQASAAGYWTVIQSSQGDPDREAEAVATLVSTKSAGAIVAPLGEASRRDLFRQIEGTMPLVVLDARVPRAVPARRRSVRERQRREGARHRDEGERDPSGADLHFDLAAPACPLPACFFA